MKNQYKFRSLLVFAFALATYGIHAGTSSLTAEKSVGELPMLSMEETIEEAAVDTATVATVYKTEQETIGPRTKKTEDPTEELFERFGKTTPNNSPHYIEHMGVQIDLTEIDLLVETEIAAGTIKTRQDIHLFRLKAIDDKALQIRDSLAQQEGRPRRPTSTR